MFSIIIPFTAFLSLVAPSYQDQKDPLRDFCRRFGHATARIDQHLFVDGGLLNWTPLDQNPNNFSNPYLLYSSLTDLQEGMPRQYANLTKPSTVPDVSGGILWADEVNKFFYQFGGEFQGTAQNFDALPYYDTLYDRWNTTNVPGDLNRVSFGAGVAVNERAEGYYLGGWMSSSTIPGWTGNPIATANLVRFDMIKRTFNNITGPDSKGRAEGSMVFLPAGDNGLLVYFGGIIDPSRNGTMVASPMSTIHVYDILSGKWYTQTATGDVPDSRRRFCAGVTWPDDHSSYNIYLYGGISIPPNGTVFDDVYILSLPSFKWIKWWPTSRSPAIDRGHHTLTCNVINRSQMIIMGGTFPNTQECDAPNQSGTHNMDLSGNSGTLWQLFNPNVTTYNIPPEIVAKIGGDSKGGATLRSPEKNWDSNDLAVYFTRIPSLTARTATRAIPSSTSPAKTGSLTGGRKIGTIIGATLGGLIFLILLLLLCLCILKRIKKKREGKEAIAPPGELDGNTSPSELYAETRGGDPKYLRGPSEGNEGDGTRAMQAYFQQSGEQHSSPQQQQQQYPQVYEMGDASGYHTPPRYGSGQGRSYSAGSGGQGRNHSVVQDRNHSTGQDRNNSVAQDRSHSTISGGGSQSPHSTLPTSPPSAPISPPSASSVFPKGPYYPASQEPAEHPALRRQRSEKGLGVGGWMGSR